MWVTRVEIVVRLVAGVLDTPETRDLCLSSPRSSVYRPFAVSGCENTIVVSVQEALEFFEFPLQH
jgi:hypothetical protein